MQLQQTLHSSGFIPPLRRVCVGFQTILIIRAGTLSCVSHIARRADFSKSAAGEPGVLHLCGTAFRVASDKFHFFERLLLLAIFAAEHDGVFLADDEARGHGLVVSDALWIGALHNSGDGLWERHTLLFHDLKVFDDAKGDVGCHDAEQVQFGIGEKFVTDFDDAFMSHLSAFEIVAYHDGGLSDVLEMKKTYDFKES